MGEVRVILPLPSWRINDHEQVVGRYQSGDGFDIYRLAISTWTFISIDHPGAVQTAAGDFTPIGGLNNNGDIASGYCSASQCEVETTGALHGVLWMPFFPFARTPDLDMVR